MQNSKSYQVQIRESREEVWRLTQERDRLSDQVKSTRSHKHFSRTGWIAQGE
jgi:hypothetical protein